MRYQGWVGVAGVLFVALAPALADAPSWVVYTSSDKQMSVRFPAKPTEKEHAGPTTGEKLRVATWIDGDKALIASGGPYAAGTPIEVKAGLDNATTSLLQKFGAHAVAQTLLTVDGVQGREVEFEGPGPYNKPLHGTARVFAVAKPPSSYLLITVQMDGKQDPNARKFLDSVHLGDKVEARP